ncbi:DUF362 domain-containing protein [Selenomonas ruminantium]|uniref:DUF362 domain-containing protein n=1 Tax=Selenomonas ruminantium TaxID=971 RepID=A0A1I0YNX3_SELRU|nr:protein of unknown function [Selenomonas ruminantium]
MNRHQAPGIHNYNVSEVVLEADVVISLPKPKTHRFGGVTAALKNMVGINANKECLPITPWAVLLRGRLLSVQQQYNDGGSQASGCP